MPKKLMVTSEEDGEQLYREPGRDERGDGNAIARLAWAVLLSLPVGVLLVVGILWWLHH